jgi:hypothetical protein
VAISLWREPTKFVETSIIVACLGDWPADGQLGEWQRGEHSVPPIVYGWLDKFGTASHAIALTNGGPTLSCILDADGEMRAPETYWEGDMRTQAEPACGTLFQPYGPLDVAHAESLVARLCIDVLTGEVKPPCHRVHASSTAQLEGSGGKWSSEHLKHRPAGFDGAFEYERSLACCGECHRCEAT